MAEAIGPLEDFARLPMVEAIDYWKQKVPMAPDEFEQLEATQRAHAFTVAGATCMDLLADIYEALGQAIEQGITQQELAGTVNELMKRRGWQGLAPYQVDNVFRTNLGVAFCAGRYQQMRSPAVLKARPYWQYDAVNDSQTRPSHRAMDGLVYPADHPFWATWYPPNGYRCRCDVVSVSAREVQDRGLTVRESIPSGLTKPDSGWDHNPAVVTWQPDLTRYPEPLRTVLEDRLRTGPSNRL